MATMTFLVSVPTKVDIWSDTMKPEYRSYNKYGVCDNVLFQYSLTTTDEIVVGFIESLKIFSAILVEIAHGKVNDSRFDEFEKNMDEFIDSLEVVSSEHSKYISTIKLAPINRNDNSFMAQYDYELVLERIHPPA